MSRVVSAFALCTACQIPEYFKVEENQIYKVLTTDFLYNGGDGFDMINGSKFSTLGKLGSQSATTFLDLFYWHTDCSFRNHYGRSGVTVLERNWPGLYRSWGKNNFSWRTRAELGKLSHRKTADVCFYAINRFYEMIYDISIISFLWSLESQLTTSSHWTIVISVNFLQL